jgi:two-component system, cell cycle sensor histidine kinase and response regulator CckA
MNQRAYLQPILLGAVFLGLYAISERIYPHGAGMEGMGPWLSAGWALGLLAVGGLEFSVLVFAAFLGSAVFSPFGEALGWFRFFWPLILTAVFSLAAYILRRLFGAPPQLTRVREMGIVMAICVASALLAACVGAWGLRTHGNNPTQSGALLVFNIGTTHLAGLLAAGVASLVFGWKWMSPAEKRMEYRDLEPSVSEFILQVLSVLAAIGIAGANHTSALAHLIGLVPLLWIAIRHGLPGASLAVLLLLAGKWYILSASETNMLLLQDIVIASTGLVVGSVISARERYQASLQARYRALNRVLEGAQLGFWEWDGGARMVIDDQWLALLGYENGQFDGNELSWRKHLHPEDLSHVLWLRDAHWKGHTPRFEAEYRLMAKDGGWRWVLDRGTIVGRDEKGTAALMAGACIDITERKRAESDLQRIVQVFDSASDFIGAADLQGNMLFANQALMRLCNDTDQAAVRRRHISEYFPEVVAQRMLIEGLPAAIAQGSWWLESVIGDAAKREIPVGIQIVVHRDGDGTPLQFSLIARDISRSRAEAERSKAALIHAMQAHKFESLAMLAGGTAHDFNNYLTAMLGSSSLARAGFALDAPAQTYFKQVETAALRAAELCQLLHLYSGRGQSDPSRTQLNTVLRDREPTLRGLCAPNAYLVVECGDDLPTVPIDVTRLEQVLDVLVLNAVESYTGGRGEVRIRTGLANLKDEDLHLPYQVTDAVVGDYVYLDVEDDGVGMSPEVKGRIFEPFFTTKQGRRGLGLMSVLASMQAHSGVVYVRSELGKGCTIRLLFPLTNIAELSPVDLPAPSPDWRSAGQVLVIDDEEAVRMVAIHMLESMGFTPLVASNGIEGVKVFRQHSSSLCAVLLDLTMPVMDGEQVFNDIRRVDAEVPIVIMTGFSEKDIRARFKDRDLAGCLHKPFSMEKLRSIMHKILASRR